MSELRIAVCGAKGRGALLAMLYQKHPQCRVVAIADRDPAAFDFHRERLTECDFTPYYDVDRMLAEAEFDWLFVATPDHTHHALTLAGLRAGHHVYVEKPMCQTVAQADEICRQAEAMQRHVVVGFELRYARPALRLRQLIQDGAIGRMVHGYCVDSINIGYSYFLRNYRHRALGVGTLMQKGTHSLDLILSFVGSEPRRIYASGGRDFFGQDPAYAGRHCRDCDERETCKFSADTLKKWRGVYLERGDNARDQCVYDPHMDTEDNVSMLVDFANGVRLTYAEIDFDPDYKREFTFVGTEGKISLVMGAEADEQGIIRLRRRHEAAEIIDCGVGEGSHFGADDAMRSAFIEAALQGGTIQPDARQGRASVAMVAAAIESMGSGLPADIPAYQGVEQAV